MALALGGSYNFAFDVIVESCVVDLLGAYSPNVVPAAERKHWRSRQADAEDNSAVRQVQLWVNKIADAAPEAGAEIAVAREYWHTSEPLEM